QHAALAVRRLERERGLAVGTEIERRAPGHELAHVARTVLAEHGDGALVAQTIACRQRVGDMLRRGVTRPDGGGDAALGVAGVAGAWSRFRENQDIARAIERGGGAQGRDAAPDYQEIGLQIFVIVSLAVHPLHIAPGVAGRLPDLLDAARVPSRRFVVSNATVWR